MNREEIISVGKLLEIMKEDAKHLEEAFKNKDLERVNSIKKELIHLSEEIDRII